MRFSFDVNKEDLLENSKKFIEAQGVVPSSIISICLDIQKGLKKSVAAVVLPIQLNFISWFKNTLNAGKLVNLFSGSLAFSISLKNIGISH